MKSKLFAELSFYSYKALQKHIQLFLYVLLNYRSHPAVTMQLDHAGLFSFITYGWISPYMKLAYKQGLKSEDLPTCSYNDGCNLSAQRYVIYL